MILARLAIVYAFLIFFLPFAFGETFPSRQEIDSLAQKTLAEWNIPGLGLAIVHKGKPLHVSGYGVRKKGTTDPVTEESLFQIASLTKGFLAASVGMLVEEGKLEWEKPIKEYLPEFQLKDEYATSSMTLRDLLSHRTGLPGTSKQCWRLWYHTGRTTEDLIRRLKDVDPAYSFRSHFSYNNMAYAVASKVVEKASGKTWPQFCQENILHPLGMKRSSLSYVRATQDANIASAHINGQPIPWDNLENMAAAVGISSSAKDMAAWLLYCLSSPKALKEAQKPQTLMEPEGLLEPISNLNWPLYTHEQKIVSYGYGWGIYRLTDKTVLFHTGMSDGMQSILAIVPEEELGIVILTNQSPGLGAACLLNEIMDRFLHQPLVSWHEKGHKIVQEITRAIKQQEDSIQKAQSSFKSTVPFSEYVGAYHHPAYGTVSVSLDRNQPVLIPKSSYHMGASKPCGSTIANCAHIYNMGQFAIVQPQELSRDSGDRNFWELALELKFWNEEKGILKGVDINRFVLLDLPSAPTFPWIIEFELSQDGNHIQALKIPDLGVFRKD